MIVLLQLLGHGLNNCLMKADVGSSLNSGEMFSKVNNWQEFMEQIYEWSVSLGERIIGALLIFVIGRLLIGVINKLFCKFLDKRNIDVSVKGFIKSFLKITLLVILIIAVVNQLGVQTSSIIALLASASVAVGLALSGQLQNFAGGLFILISKPYKVGDWIDCQSVSGSVEEIQMFHTILITADHKKIYVPNGTLSTSSIVNYTKSDKRRVEWIVGVEYGEDYDKVQKVLLSILHADERILHDPEPFIALHQLDASSVNVVARVWVSTADYWGVYFDVNKEIYQRFNAEGIDFPFPQMVVHQK